MTSKISECVKKVAAMLDISVEEVEEVIYAHVILENIPYSDEDDSNDKDYTGESDESDEYESDEYSSDDLSEQEKEDDKLIANYKKRYNAFMRKYSDKINSDPQIRKYFKSQSVEPNINVLYFDQILTFDAEIILRYAITFFSIALLGAAVEKLGRDYDKARKILDANTDYRKNNPFYNEFIEEAKEAITIMKKIDIPLTWL